MKPPSDADIPEEGMSAETQLLTAENLLDLAAAETGVIDQVRQLGAPARWSRELLASMMLGRL